jgi:tetratricopeptide (TPR) repeat protein
MKLWHRVSGVAVLLLCVRAVASPIDRMGRARELYTRGATQYAAQQFSPALDLFKQAYLVEPSPALLFNMAACLERLERPHDSAEELRAYLRAQPDAPNRSEIESRVRGLEESQRLIDADRLKNAPPQLIAVTPPPSKWPRKRILELALPLVGVIVVGVALGVGLGIGLQPHYPSSSLQTQVVTP